MKAIQAIGIIAGLAMLAAGIAPLKPPTYENSPPVDDAAGPVASERATAAGRMPAATAETVRDDGAAVVSYSVEPEPPPAVTPSREAVSGAPVVTYYAPACVNGSCGPAAQGQSYRYQRTGPIRRLFGRR